MSYGKGQPGIEGYGDADSWGGPQDGIDILQGIGEVRAKPSARISQNTYIFLIMLGALVALWLMGGVFFRNVRI